MSYQGPPSQQPQQPRQPDPSIQPPITSVEQPVPGQTLPTAPSLQPPGQTTQQSRPQMPGHMSYTGPAVVQPAQAPLPQPQPRFPRIRSWLRTRQGRIIVPVVALLLGFLCGLTALLWYGYAAEGPLTIVSNPPGGNIIVEADRSFITALVQKSLESSGLPGQITNVRVDLEHNAQLTINGDNVYSVLGVSLSRHFTFVVQLYIQSCVVQMHLVHVDTGGIPLTTFAQLFEGNINQQLQKKPAGLPSGFTYCAVHVQTQTAGIFITYLATPVSS